MRIGKDARRQDGKAARAGAQVEDAAYRRGIGHQRKTFAAEQVGEQQFADERARHDHPLIDVEGDALDIGLLGQIGGGHALHDALLDAAEHYLALALRQPRIGPGIDVVNRKVKRLEDQEGRLIDGARRPLAENEARLRKAADGKAQHVANGNEVIGMAFHDKTA